MRKALATFACGPARSLLHLSLPSFHAYATRHEYHVVVGDGDSLGRPPAWGKILLLRELLRTYDLVLWIDADALILDTSVDVETLMPREAFQAFVVTRGTPDFGVAPCTGVWAMRAGTESARFLDALWAQDDLTDHQWWEQAALMRLMGWTLTKPIRKERFTEWDEGTFELPEEWDMIPWWPIGYTEGKVRHYAGWAYRRRRFDMRTDLARLEGQQWRYCVGLLERRWRHVYWPVTGRLRMLAGRLSRIRPR